MQSFCKDQKVFRETCGTPANTSKKFLGFAAFLQKCFSLFWRLQDFCKDAFPHFGVCRTSARTLFLILVFAETLHREPIYLNGRMLPIM